ncbi:hypothetical protein [Sphingobacterium psychroaquaticum]|uniref:PEP-CTERM protein-sorting domain-containing protein n=1 Tax=Sphingobacterium psychroaquaticum TaxID=561061 RepID=A0A1X7I9G0_9SPHI|nr:hypothetical protein [Sphingobacterium psychroaquaticum]QBQ41830.1 hypothetical protein E2P86_11960 [Sphingobacterium psychroaquaticum]SMG10747.1 PEP-CTERM protein-sorting domain-containing protein [Sphingobacterium psychroaquaticum]
MKPKTIISSIILALLIVILFNNKEEASFWLFGEIRTSKLFIIGTFFLIGLVTGGLVFRRRSKHPKEYSVSNGNQPDTDFIDDGLTDEDRKFLGKE